MKLEPGERSILASFASGPHAEEALNDLRQAGFGDSQMDRIGQYGYDADVDQRRPAIRGNESSLARTTLDPAQLGDDSRVFLAAMPEASGMTDGSQDVLPFLVTVVTSEHRLDEAVTIVQRHGGRV